MIATIRDALVYFDNYGTPLVGDINVETPINKNSMLDIYVGSQNFTVFVKQISYLVFKINDKKFGFISDGCFYHDDDWDYWNEVTWNEAGHQLQENFPNLVERTNQNESNN